MKTHWDTLLAAFWLLCGSVYAWAALGKAQVRDFDLTFWAFAGLAVLLVSNAYLRYRTALRKRADVTELVRVNQRALDRAERQAAWRALDDVLALTSHRAVLDQLTPDVRAALGFPDPEPEDDTDLRDQLTASLGSGPYPYEPARQIVTLPSDVVRVRENWHRHGCSVRGEWGGRKLRDWQVEQGLPADGWWGYACEETYRYLARLPEAIIPPGTAVPGWARSYARPPGMPSTGTTQGSGQALARPSRPSPTRRERY